MLKFIGSGSAFNTKLGNNSAYYKEENQMLLIDCGSNIFQRIKENNLLEGIEQIHVLVTHTHADHVGSLADLILYTYYSHGEFAKPKVTVYNMFDVEVRELLTINGCVEGIHYNQVVNDSELDNVIIDTFNDLEFYFDESKHVDEIPSYSLDISINEKDIYYSSDSNEVPEFVINVLDSKNSKYDYLFIDTCKADYNGNVHLSLRELTEIIEPEYRHKVWCMHLDEGFNREEAEALGFNVVKNELEIMELKHQHDIQLLEMQQKMERHELLKSCTHMYEDGTPAKVGKGVQWDMYYECEICGKSLKTF